MVLRTMAATNQEMLDLINAVITKRLAGDAYNSYTAQQQRFEGESLDSLFKTRETLQRMVAAENGGNFSLAQPLPDEDWSHGLH
jgi:hypothetical protein